MLTRADPTNRCRADPNMLSNWKPAGLVADRFGRRIATLLGALLATVGGATQAGCHDLVSDLFIRTGMQHCPPSSPPL